MSFEFTYPNTALFNVEKVKKLLGNEIKKTIDTMANQAVNKIVLEAPSASGQLKNSVNSERVNDFQARVFVGVDYGVVVEKGRRPNQTPPPYRPLMKWIKGSKQGNAFANKAYQSSLDNDNKITLVGLAMALAKHIGKFGFEANPFFNRGLTKSEQVFEKESELLMIKIKEGLMA